MQWRSSARRCEKRNKASKERLEKLEKDLADLKEERTTLMARWQQEKEAIQPQRQLKEELEQLRLEIERAQRAGEASELQYSRLPEIERLMRAEDEHMASAARLAREERAFR